MISNPFTSGFINHTNITGYFSYKRINHLRTNNINIPIEDANTLTPKPITTQEAILSGIESTIKSIGHTLTDWKYTNHKSNEIGHIGHRIMRITRDLLNILSGCNIIGLLSSTLTEYEIINLKPIKSMFNSFMIKEHLDCKDNVKWKLLQLISQV